MVVLTTIVPSRPFLSLPPSLQPVIRAYRAQPRFHSRFATLLNINSSWWFSFLGVSRWIGFRLDAIAACIVMVMVIVTMALRQAQPGIVALAFSYVLQLR